MAERDTSRTYTVVIARRATKALQALPDKVQRQIEKRIDALANEPRPVGMEQIKGQSPPLYRVRAGDFRILYRVEDDRLVVLVAAAGHRKDISRDL